MVVANIVLVQYLCHTFHSFRSLVVYYSSVHIASVSHMHSLSDSAVCQFNGYLPFPLNWMPIQYFKVRASQLIVSIYTLTEVRIFCSLETHQSERFWYSWLRYLTPHPNNKHYHREKKKLILFRIFTNNLQPPESGLELFHTTRPMPGSGLFNPLNLA